LLYFEGRGLSSVEAWPQPGGLYPLQRVAKIGQTLSIDLQTLAFGWGFIVSY